MVGLRLYGQRFTRSAFLGLVDDETRRRIPKHTSWMLETPLRVRENQPYEEHEALGYGTRTGALPFVQLPWWRQIRQMLRGTCFNFSI